jgi:hypothetical protein
VLGITDTAGPRRGGTSARRSILGHMGSAFSVSMGARWFFRFVFGNHLASGPRRTWRTRDASAGTIRCFLGEDADAALKVMVNRIVDFSRYRFVALPYRANRTAEFDFSGPTLDHGAPRHCGGCVDLAPTNRRPGPTLVGVLDLARHCCLPHYGKEGIHIERRKAGYEREYSGTTSSIWVQATVGRGIMQHF